MPIKLRPARPEDEEFLYRLYANTRADDLAAWGWDEAQQQTFINMQFRAQEMHYAEYENTDQQIIINDAPDEMNGEQPIGRLLLSRLEDAILVVDIALLSECRGQGIGAAVLDKVFDEATQAGKAVRGHVAKSNRAQQLWWRLGFKAVGDTGAYYAVEWQPASKTEN